MATQQPISNPIIPFQGPIFSGLHDGKMMLIQGQILPNAKRFAINLLCGDGNIAFHFNPRFDESTPTVVCNTKQSLCWGQEERKHMPFQRGVYFELIINVKSHCFQVSVNGQHFLEYRHRLPLCSVDRLGIEGDVHINSISFSGQAQVQAVNVTNLGFAPKLNPMFDSGSYQTVSNPAVPFLAFIPGGLNPRKKITILGNVKPNANRFQVNLKISSQGNIAFHLAPRLSEGTLVRNHCISGNWGSEERQMKYMPFARGQAFQIEIRVQNNCYKIFVNGIHAFDFVHRIPFNQVDQIEIKEDVTITYVLGAFPALLNSTAGGGGKGKQEHNNGSGGGRIIPASQLDELRSVRGLQSTGKMATQQPISNPIIPFQGPIFSGLHDGKMMLIQGQILPNAKRFAINLLCGDGNTAFHFNPRFDESTPTVVCNTKQSLCWGQEERKHMPFQQGVYFELIINVKSHCFQVSVNGQHFLEYRHRLPLCSIDRLGIEGDVHINNISFSGQAGSYQTVSNPAVPFLAFIQGGLYPGKKIMILGNVKSNADRFQFNLKISSLDNIAFHFAPRLCENALVRNHRISGNWGSEERQMKYMPFAPGQAFQIEIHVKDNCYQVFVNGNHVCDFVHRLPFNQVDQIEITEDVIITQVHY
ncbi:galectin-9-like [Latimeria chalumnae]|uniref:galectin-9-like n=1 Tax=Latimeria chalumnae TaxID=7897 RepID=UPI00313C4385